MGRVRIGTCSGPADAALVRAAFEAHSIPVVINAEQHASMLAGLGGALVPLHVLVDEERAEEAAALLADLRDKDRRQDAIDDAGSEEDDEPDPELAAHAVARAARRQRNGVLLLIVLGGAVATPYVIGKPLLSVLLVIACIGAMVLTLRSGHPAAMAELPRARINRR
jgi:hypothetical protein